MEVMRAISAPGPHEKPPNLQPATVDKCIPSWWKSRWRVGGGAENLNAVAVALTPLQLHWFTFIFFVGQRLQYFCVFISD